uniref:C-X-C motif chemokine 11-like n=1 Tax=Myripristis murdjan TaxID=586833 RepID=A0A667WMN6_9TELE
MLLHCQLGSIVPMINMHLSLRVSGSPFVPGRCLCPETQNAVRGQLKDLAVLPKSHNCDRNTVIVTLKKNSELVCLNPEAPLGKLLIRCWNRAKNLGRDVRLCLKRRRRRGQQHPRQRKRGHSRRLTSSN